MGRILAVDDDAISRALMVDALRALGHEVATVGTAQEALLRLRRDAFDVVITDIVMPGMDGLELARRVAAGGAPVPVLLVSAAARPDLGAVPHAGFLAKPLDGDRLGRALDTVFASVRRAAAPPPVPEWSGAEFLATVSGPLERFPPIRVLFLAHRVAASGALRVEIDGKPVLVGLRGGKVLHASGVPGLFAGLVPKVPDDLAAGLGAAVASGHPPDQALAAAAQGLGTWLATLVDARGGLVTFDPAWGPPTGAFPLPDPVPRLVARGLAFGRPDALVARAWRALEAAGLSLRLPDDSPESRWGIDATSMRVLRLTPKARTVDALLREAAGADPARRTEVLRALDTLMALGLVVVDGGGLDAKPAAARGRPADATQEDPRARRLSEAAAAMERAHAVEILELADRRRITEEDVANAYRDISRRYHPDTFFNAPPAVRALAETCFARVNAAYDALRVPGGLAEAKRFLEARAQGVAFVTEKEHLTARVAFRRAEVAYRARDWKAADPLFQEAARLDSRTWPHALYAAYCGWLAKRLSAAEALQALDALKPPEPLRAAEVLVYAGTLLKLEGRDTEAIERFRAAAQKDPTNREAQREIRLYELRNPTPPKGPGAGIFGGLLNRKRE